MNGEQFIRLVSTFLNHNNDPRRPRRAGNRVRARRNFRTNPNNYGDRGYQRYNSIRRTSPDYTNDRRSNASPTHHPYFSDRQVEHHSERSYDRKTPKIPRTNSHRITRGDKNPGHNKERIGSKPPGLDTDAIIMDQSKRTHIELSVDDQNAIKSDECRTISPDIDAFKDSPTTDGKNPDKRGTTQLNSGDQNMQNTQQMEMHSLQIQHQRQSRTTRTHPQDAFDNPDGPNLVHSGRISPEPQPEHPTRMEDSPTTNKSEPRKTKPTKRIPRNTIISPETIPTPRHN